MSKTNVVSVPFFVINRLPETGCGNAAPAFKTAAATVNLGGVVILGFVPARRDSILDFHFGLRFWVLVAVSSFLLADWLGMLPFLSFYRTAGLAWIRGGRCAASFPMFYRAAGLGPDLFGLSHQLDERRRGCFAARIKELLKEQAGRRPRCTSFRQPPKNPSIRSIEGKNLVFHRLAQICARRARRGSSRPPVGHTAQFFSTLRGHALSKPLSFPLQGDTLLSLQLFHPAREFRRPVASAKLAPFVIGASSFPLFYLLTGLGWICEKTASAPLPVFYRAAGLGPSMFGLSLRALVWMRASGPAIAAQAKVMLKEEAAERTRAHQFGSPAGNAAAWDRDTQKSRVSSAYANLRKPIGTGGGVAALLNVSARPMAMELASACSSCFFRHWCFAIRHSRSPICRQASRWP